MYLPNQTSLSIAILDHMMNVLSIQIVDIYIPFQYIWYICKSSEGSDEVKNALEMLSPYWSDPKYRQCVPNFSSVIDTLPVTLHHISAYGIVKQYLGFNIMHHFC